MVKKKTQILLKIMFARLCRIVVNAPVSSTGDRRFESVQILSHLIEPINLLNNYMLNTLLHFTSSKYKTDVQVFPEPSNSQKIYGRSLPLEITKKADKNL